MKARLKTGDKVRARYLLRAVGDPTPVPAGMGGVVSSVTADSKFGWYGVTFDNGVEMFINVEELCEQPATRRTR